MSTASRQVRTITEFVAERPDVDVTKTWEVFWDILTGLKDRIVERFDVQRHSSSEGLESWQAGDFEGSMNTYTGPEAEWFVHSWAGNRTSSILDMNITVWLGPHIDVPHLAIVLGTVPRQYHYSDFLARRDLAANADYVQRYYEPENQPFLEFRGDERFLWSVSHGTYMRSVLSPAAYSFMVVDDDADLTDVIAERVNARFERWLALVDAAGAVPESEQPALRARDHVLRRNCYTLDPMNALARKFMGADMVSQLVSARMGEQQMAELGS